MPRTSLGPRWRIIWLVGIAGLFVAGEARAQSRASDQRSFVRLLARRASLERAEGRMVGASARGVPRGERIRPERRRGGGGSHGRGPASPLVPSGHGVGRDIFAESMYQEAFGRLPDQRELDRLTRMLQSGMSPERLGMILWSSPEHRALRRSGRAPDLLFDQAYQKAIADSWRARRGIFPPYYQPIGQP